MKEEYELIIEEKKAAINIHSKLPVVKSIPIQMHQLFSNLLSNSLKFSNKKPIIDIDVAQVQIDPMDYPNLDPHRKYWKFEIKDNGVGFDERYADQVFKLFKRLDLGISGVGVGLALCKKIVEKHNGNIELDSEVNKGTMFTILLPIL